MKKHISGIVSTLAVLACVAGGLLPASAETTPKGPDNEVIELKSSFNQGASLNHTYYLNAFTLPADYVPQEGDALEYDVKTNVESAGVGGLDIASIKDGDASFSPMRDTSGTTDEDGTGAHPSSDISAFAYDEWYSRKILLPETFFGKTEGLKVMMCFDMVECKPYVGKEVYALFDNIRITRNGETLYLLFADNNDKIVTDSFLMDMFSGNMFAETTVKVIKESEAGPMISSGTDDPVDSEPAGTTTKATTAAQTTKTTVPPSASQADQTDGGSNWWIWLIVAGVLIAAAAVVAVVLVKKKKAQPK